MAQLILSGSTADAALYLSTGRGSFEGWDSDYPASFAWRLGGVTTLLWGALLADDLTLLGAERRPELEFLADPSTLSFAEPTLDFSRELAWFRIVDWAGRGILGASAWGQRFQAQNRDDYEQVSSHIATSLAAAVEHCLFTGATLLAHPVEMALLATLLPRMGTDEWWKRAKRAFGGTRRVQFPLIQGVTHFESIRSTIAGDLDAIQFRTWIGSLTDIPLAIMSAASGYQEFIPRTLTHRASEQVVELRQWVDDTLPLPEGPPLSHEERLADIDHALRRDIVGAADGRLQVLSCQAQSSATGSLLALAFHPTAMPYSSIIRNIYGLSPTAITPYFEAIVTE